MPCLPNAGVKEVSLTPTQFKYLFIYLQLEKKIMHVLGQSQPSKKQEKHF